MRGVQLAKRIERQKKRLTGGTKCGIIPEVMPMKRCVVLIPVNYNDGAPVPEPVITRIRAKIDEVADGHYVAGVGPGTYRMASGQMHTDICLQVWIAVDPDRIGGIKQLAAWIGRVLRQESVYFEVLESDVEFIPPETETGRDE